MLKALAAKLADATGCKLETAMRAKVANIFKIDGMSDCFFKDSVRQFYIGAKPGG